MGPSRQPLRSDFQDFPALIPDFSIQHRLERQNCPCRARADTAPCLIEIVRVWWGIRDLSPPPLIVMGAHAGRRAPGAIRCGPGDDAGEMMMVGAVRGPDRGPGQGSGRVPPFEASAPARDGDAWQGIRTLGGVCLRSGQGRGSGWRGMMGCREWCIDRWRMGPNGHYSPPPNPTALTRRTTMRLIWRLQTSKTTRALSGGSWVSYQRRRSSMARLVTAMTAPSPAWSVLERWMIRRAVPSVWTWRSCQTSRTTSERRRPVQASKLMSARSRMARGTGILLEGPPDSGDGLGIKGLGLTDSPVGCCGPVP